MEKEILVKKLWFLVKLIRNIDSVETDGVYASGTTLKEELAVKAVESLAENIFLSSYGEIKLDSTKQVSLSQTEQKMNAQKVITPNIPLNTYDDTGIIEIDMDDHRLISGSAKVPLNETNMAIDLLSVKNIGKMIADNKINKKIRIEGIKNLNKILVKEGKSISDLFLLKQINDRCEKFGLVPEGAPGGGKYRGLVLPKKILPTKEWTKSDKFKTLRKDRDEHVNQKLKDLQKSRSHKNVSKKSPRKRTSRATTGNKPVKKA